MESTRCPVCAADLDPAAAGVRACPRCETPHHGDCWDYAGGCAVFGCRPGEARPRPEAALATSPDHPTRRQLALDAVMGRLCGFTSAALGMGLTAALLLFVFEPYLATLSGAAIALGLMWNMVNSLMTASGILLPLLIFFVGPLLTSQGLLPRMRLGLPDAPAAALTLPERLLVALAPAERRLFSLPHLALVVLAILVRAGLAIPDEYYARVPTPPLLGSDEVALALPLVVGLFAPIFLSQASAALRDAAAARSWLASTGPDELPPLLGGPLPGKVPMPMPLPPSDDLT